MKTAERAHTPAKLWERIRLSKQYSKALQQLDERLVYWPKFLVHKCKQRLTRLTQVAITQRRLALKETERRYVGVKSKVRRREQTRERKALAAAKVEKAIEKELLERLKSGAYGEQPLNVDEKIWKKVLGKEEEEALEDEQELEGEEEDEEEFDEEEEESDVGEVEYVAGDDEDEIVDMEDLEKWLGQSDSEDGQHYSESGSDSSSDEDDEDSESEEDSSDDKSVKRKRAPEPKKKKPASSSKRSKSGKRIEVEYEQELNTNQPVSTNW